MKTTQDHEDTCSSKTIQIQYTLTQGDEAVINFLTLTSCKTMHKMKRCFLTFVSLSEKNDCFYSRQLLFVEPSGDKEKQIYVVTQQREAACV